MFKKVLPFLIILLLAVPIAIFYHFFKDVEIPDSRLDAIEAVPINAVLILESESVPGVLQKLNNQKNIVEDLLYSKDLKPAIEAIGVLDSLMTTDEQIASSWKQAPVIFSIHQTGDHQFDFLAILQTNGKISSRDLKTLLSRIFGQEGTSTNRTYSKTKMMEIQYPDQSLIKSLNLVQLKKYLIFSPSQTLLENAVRQIKNGTSLNQMPGFREATQVAGLNVDAHLYVNLPEMPEWVKGFIHSDISKKLAAGIGYGSWMELDLKLQSDALVASGFGFTGDTLAWLDLFGHQNPSKFGLDQILPANTMTFLGFGVEHGTTLFEGIANQYKGTSYGKEYTRLKTSLARQTGEDIHLAFSSILKEEYALAYLPGKDDGIETALLMGTVSRNMALEKLSAWLELKARNEGKALQNYRSSYNVDQQRRHFIYEMPVEDLPEALFGQIFASLKGKFFGFAGNHLIIADTRQVIQDIIYFNELGKTLSTDPVYSSSLSHISTRGNFIFYSAPFRSLPVVQQKANEKWAANAIKNSEFLERVGAVSFTNTSQK